MKIINFLIILSTLNLVVLNYHNVSLRNKAQKHKILIKQHNDDITQLRIKLSKLTHPTKITKLIRSKTTYQPTTVKQFIS